MEPEHIRRDLTNTDVYAAVRSASFSSLLEYGISSGIRYLCRYLCRCPCGSFVCGVKDGIAMEQDQLIWTSVDCKFWLQDIRCCVKVAGVEKAECAVFRCAVLK